MSEELDIAQQYRQHAEELRIIAALEGSRENRDALEQIARDYEIMAETLVMIDKTTRAIKRPRTPS